MDDKTNSSVPPFAKLAPEQLLVATSPPDSIRVPVTGSTNHQGSALPPIEQPRKIASPLPWAWAMDTREREPELMASKKTIVVEIGRCNMESPFMGRGFVLHAERRSFSLHRKMRFRSLEPSP